MCCDKCHENIEGDSYIVYNESDDALTYCEDCSNNTFHCDNCNRYYDSDECDSYESKGGDTYCECCADRLLTLCDFCGEYEDADEVITINHHHYCRDCAEDKLHKCESCGDYIEDDEWYQGPDGCDYCESCWNDAFFCCDCCGETYSYDEYDQDGVCVHCSTGEYIYEYSYKPDPVFHQEDGESTKEYFGVELEIEGNERKELSETLECETDFVYCKKDTSLDCGVEIVSHPATYQYHINHWKDIFENINNYNMSAKNTCGLHFHISRDFFTEEGLKVIDCFVNNNEEFISKFSGRKFTYYCHKKCNENWGYSSEHSDCVNFLNSNTVEVRVCASTVNYDTFIKRLTFVKNLVEFANSTTMRKLINSDNMVEMFEKFVANNKAA